MSAKRLKIKNGDVIAIPVDEKRNTFGQFVEGDMLLGYYVVYDVISEQYPSLAEIINQNKIFAFFTQGYYIIEGRWKIIGNISVPSDIQVPLFKVELYENNTRRWMVTDYKGDILRQATDFEKDNLIEMDSYTSALIDNAIKAKYGLLKWESIYNGLLYRKQMGAR